MVSETTVTAVAAVCGAAITAGPLYLSLRRTRGDVQTQGTETREAVGDAFETVLARMDGRLTGMRDEMQTDVRELRSDIRSVHDWQISHTAEHMLIAGYRRPDTEE